MMNLVLFLTIVAITPQAPTVLGDTGAADVFRCPFDPSWDEDFDGWPDGWTRRRGHGFPHYVTVEISEEASPVGDRCLRIDLDGGGAVAYSPPIRINALYDYRLQAWVRTERLKHDRAHISLTLLDALHHRLETFCSVKTGEELEWRQLTLGPVTPQHAAAAYAVIGLHLEPPASGPADLRGAALFDDVRLSRLPQLTVSLGDALHVFTDPDDVIVTCRASGLSEAEAEVAFHLEDPFGESLQTTRRRLDTRPALTDAELPGLRDTENGRSSTRSVEPPAAEAPWDEQPCLTGTAQWKPSIPGAGFYRLRVELYPSAQSVRSREVTLAVVETARPPEKSRFGWTLPHRDQPLAPPELGDLLSHSGIRWIKYPLWTTSEADEAGEPGRERFLRFTERLASQGIEMVGLLDVPPASVRDRLFAQCGPSPAKVFSAEPEVWSKSLQEAMARPSTRVRWWQLGGDGDTSFVGYPRLAEKIAQVKGEMERFGSKVNVGFGWDAAAAPPEIADGPPPWQFLSVAAPAPAASRQLPEYFARDKQPPSARWIVLEPLSRHRYCVEDRIKDLVERMASAAAHGIEGVFVRDPFDSEHGLLHEDGTPGELLVPWRTTALLLGNARYLGSLEMPQGSRNRVFSRGNDAVMIMWNETPVREAIYLGQDVRQIDLWGRATRPDRQDHRQMIEVGPLPTFVVGLDESVVRWRQSFSIHTPRIPSIVGTPHEGDLGFVNHFDRKVTGELELVTPPGWTAKPRQSTFQLDRGQAFGQPLTVKLPYNGIYGPHKIRADFEVRTGRVVRFSVYRTVELGLGGVQVDLAVRVTGEGDLEVEQRFANQTDQPVKFRCYLFAPNRRRLSTQVVHEGPGENVQIYRLPNGAELVGKPLWLRAEEIDGPRVLNYRVDVPPPG